jgi:hypothetical protein
MVPSVFHVSPPSVVAKTVVHAVEEAHGSTPSIQPSFGDTQLSDWARKPTGIAERDGFAADAATGPKSPTVSRTATLSDTAVEIVERLMLRTSRARRERRFGSICSLWARILRKARSFSGTPRSNRTPVVVPNGAASGKARV